MALHYGYHIFSLPAQVEAILYGDACDNKEAFDEEYSPVPDIE